jgi:uncharacterized protein with FMN-binding domain
MSTKTAGLLVIALIAVIGVGIFSFTGKEKKDIQNTTPPTVAVQETKSTYKDGAYEQIGNYTSPAGAEEIDVKLTIKNGIVTASDVIPKATAPKSKFMQGVFVENYKQMVIGKNISDLKLGKVAGSSLTPQGFNDALERIKAQAQT